MARVIRTSLLPRYSYPDDIVLSDTGSWRIRYPLPLLPPPPSPLPRYRKISFSFSKPRTDGDVRRRTTIFAPRNYQRCSGLVSSRSNPDVRVEFFFLFLPLPIYLHDDSHVTRTVSSLPSKLSSFLFSRVIMRVQWHYI